jgi:hypothetical protein
MIIARPTELKLVSLKLPGNEDLKSVFKFFWQVWTKQQRKTSDQFVKVFVMK